MSIDRVPPSVELISRISSSVVLGAVTGVGAAQWDTPEGAVPAGREGISSFNVIRRIRVMVDDDAADSGRDDAEITAWVRGGRVGVGAARAAGLIARSSVPIWTETSRGRLAGGSLPMVELSAGT